MLLTREMVSYWAPSPDALKRSRAVSFSRLSAFGDSLRGQCGGSGGEYDVSVDLSDQNAPAFACSCPSRQKPCKHAIALMVKRIDEPELFAQEPPDFIFSAKKKNSTGRFDSSRDLIRDSARSASLERAAAMLIRIAGDMHSAFTPGAAQYWIAQAEALAEIPAVADRMCALPWLFQKEPTLAAAESTRLFALCERAISWLSDVLSQDDPELETLLGRVWRTHELSALGLSRRGVRLLQLAFEVTDNPRRRLYEDTGVWAADGGHLYITKDYKPYAVSGRIKTGDSFFGALNVDELLIYPGIDRVRWTRAVPSPATASDWESLCRGAPSSMSEVTARLARIMSDKYLLREPYALACFECVKKNDGMLFLCDGAGMAIKLGDGEYPSCRALEAVYSREWKAVLLKCLRVDESNTPVAEPLCLISHTGALRLTP